MAKKSYERVPIDKIISGLNDHSEALCGIWLGNGVEVRDGGKLCWRVGDITNSPSRKKGKEGVGSFSMILSGKFRGKGKDFAYDISGKNLAVDWLDVIEANIVPNDMRDTPRVAAIKWAIDFLWLGAPAGATANKRVVANRISNDNGEADAAKKLEWCRAILEQGVDFDNRGRKGVLNPVEKYLHGRGITMPLAPGMLFYHPRCAYKHGDGSVEYFPAMLAPVLDVNGKLQALHRTYVAEDGGAKAPVPSARKMLGNPSGGAVRLVDDEDVRSILGIAEGIETALSVMQMYDLPVWASLSTWGMATLVLPPHVREPVHFPDNDPAQIDQLSGRPKRGPDGGYIHAGLNAALLAAERYQEEGRTPQLVPVPERDCADFNDVLKKTCIAEKTLVAIG